MRARVRAVCSRARGNGEWQVPAPFALEMAKIVADNVAAGNAACLPASPYKGNTQWFDGFTSQMDSATAQSFRKSQGSIDFTNSPPAARSANSSFTAGSAALRA